MAVATQIAHKFTGDRLGAIAAITTPPAQAVVAATRSVPVVYSDMIDPVVVQLVENWASAGTNVTGVSDKLSLDKQVMLIKRVVPNTECVGMVYGLGEASPVVVVTELKKLLLAQDVTLVESAAPRTVGIAPTAKNLIGKVDVIYMSTDNNVMSVYESLVKVANEAKVPLVADDTDNIKCDATAALGINYYKLGQQTGKVVARILKGEKPGVITSVSSSDLELLVNEGAVKKQGATLSTDLLKDAKEVIK